MTKAAPLLGAAFAFVTAQTTKKRRPEKGAFITLLGAIFLFVDCHGHQKNGQNTNETSACAAAAYVLYDDVWCYHRVCQTARKAACCQ